VARGWYFFMSVLGWLVGLLLAPVFILIGLAAIIIESLFRDEGIDWDD